ncbi:wax ester/triacylglycerol synthase family O-acyltransferase [Streptomyces sp. DSM 42041]|uniref:Wax ester/triacylglycerol synthase family O-acyltransferase n=1 Tax=Streptomyces hazeniae TaxID=3075538 RepID=A0ABU2NU81_9ACTN|nr:wax ester/triacylglycerol synthase domain-containing protein [Streptomyces sp. DSM 42041]MDT0380551.1 wax ester/triacylglycerol synthase family O-acyltransferase [Streptomyces sp. DSM 42041]
MISLSRRRRAETPPPMGPVDLAYFRAARGVPLPTGFLFGFRGAPPPLDALRARVGGRGRRLPVLHHRIATHRPVVERADRFTVEEHVHEAELPDGGGMAEAGRLMLDRPLPSDGRPPWEVWLFHGPGDGYALCYRGDHTLQDGAGAAHTARFLLGDHPAGGPAGRRPAWPTPIGAADALGDMLSAYRPPRDPLPQAFTVRPAGRSGMCVADAPMARLRAIGRAAGGTVNDVYLAALAHAFRSWHLKTTGTPPPPLPVAMPMSVRAPGEELLPGNHMIMTRLLLPTDEGSPAGALERVIAWTGEIRRTRRRDATRLLLAAGPAAVGAAVGVRMVNGRRIAGPVSGMDLGGPLVHGGDTAVSAGMFTGLAGGVLCYTSLTGYHGTARLTLVHDLALRGVDALTEHWLSALDQLDDLRPSPR